MHAYIPRAYVYLERMSKISVRILLSLEATIAWGRELEHGDMSQKAQPRAAASEVFNGR